ncbi:hypothetical protein OTK51_08385 [Vibrio scophthalmi]|uniref:hypothetical protein n=1 Tax=Vibrio scophthalmi TaxID=45658 RepID=UPI0022841580|nr:hypothetical protein [Vibrio scophthalmi]MCY9803451.1 hypothetical protein [Vibrio scophthalmi]
MSQGKLSKPIKIFLVVIAIGWVLSIIICQYRNYDKRSRASVNHNPMSFQLAKACTYNNNCLEGYVVLGSGEITNTTHSRFKDMLEFVDKNEIRLSAVCFDSPGGDNEDGGELGKSISIRGLNTCLADKYYDTDGNLIPKATKFESDSGLRVTSCISMCPFVYMSGQERIMVGQSPITAFHSSKSTMLMCGCEFDSWDTVGDSNMKKQFADLLGKYSSNNPKRIPLTNDEGIVDRTFKIPTAKLSTASQETLTELRIVTKQIE